MQGSNLKEQLQIERDRSANLEKEVRLKNKQVQEIGNMLQSAQSKEKEIEVDFAHA